MADQIDADFSEAASFNSGLRMALTRDFDLIILDMSMPTFDRTESTHGGRFRILAGKEIVTRLAKAGKLGALVILTGYKDFSVDSQSLSIDEIDASMKEYGESYLGYIMFDSADSVWKEELLQVANRVKN